MENATTKTSKPSSNITEMVSKFAKVCKLRSIGVFTNENQVPHDRHPQPNPKEQSTGEDNSDATKETGCDGEKIHPQPAVGNKSSIIGNKYILELFDVVSALKLAYIQLQEAHIPYIPEKIIAADELVVALLESLCKIKQRYKEKQFAKSKLDSSLLGCLRAEIQVNEEVLEKLKSKNSEKDAEIACLRQELHDFDFRNAILVEKTRQESLVRKNARIMNIAMFEDTFKNASKSIHDFAKPVISLMKASGWDLDLAADSIESGVVYFKRSDKKFAFEAFIARRMFHGMSLKSHNVDDILMVDDPLHYLIENPHSEFADFCRKKYLFVTHPVMELSFLGNLDQRMFVLSGKHPRTPFYQIFTRMAKWVWVLQQIATSIDLKAKIFAVNRGCQFSDIYMERIDKKGEGTADLDERHSSCKVEFMVMPGFKVGDTVVKAQVYVSEVRPSHGTY